MEHVGGTSSWDCLGDQTLRKSWIAWVLLFVWWNLRIQDSLAFTYRYPTDNQEMPNRYESWETPDPFLPCPRFLLWWFGIIFIDPSEDLRDRIQKLQESSETACFWRKKIGWDWQGWGIVWRESSITAQQECLFWKVRTDVTSLMDTHSDCFGKKTAGNWNFSWRGSSTHKHTHTHT